VRLDGASGDGMTFAEQLRKKLADRGKQPPINPSPVTPSHYITRVWVEPSAFFTALRPHHFLDVSGVTVGRWSLPTATATSSSTTTSHLVYVQRTVENRWSSSSPSPSPTTAAPSWIHLPHLPDLQQVPPPPPPPPPPPGKLGGRLSMANSFIQW
jgi:hypothetical protein